VLHIPPIWSFLFLAVTIYKKTSKTFQSHNLKLFRFRG
jgi:hypothetical protein